MDVGESSGGEGWIGARLLGDVSRARATALRTTPLSMPIRQGIEIALQRTGALRRSKGASVPRPASRGSSVAAEELERSTTVPALLQQLSASRTALAEGPSDVGMSELQSRLAKVESVLELPLRVSTTIQSQPLPEAGGRPGPDAAASGGLAELESPRGGETVRRRTWVRCIGVWERLAASAATLATVIAASATASDKAVRARAQYRATALLSDPATRRAMRLPSREAVSAEPLLATSTRPATEFNSLPIRGGSLRIGKTSTVGLPAVMDPSEAGIESRPLSSGTVGIGSAAASTASRRGRHGAAGGGMGGGMGGGGGLAGSGLTLGAEVELAEAVGDADLAGSADAAVMGAAAVGGRGARPRSSPARDGGIGDEWRGTVAAELPPLLRRAETAVALRAGAGTSGAGASRSPAFEHGAAVSSAAGVAGSRGSVGQLPGAESSGTGGGIGGSTSSHLEGSAGGGENAAEVSAVPPAVLVALRERGLLEALPAPPRGGASRQRSEHDTTVELLRLRQWLGLAHSAAWQDARRALKDASGLVGAGLAGQVKFGLVPMAQWLDLAAPQRGAF